MTHNHQTSAQPTALIQRAMGFLGAKQWTAAEATLQEALAVAPRSVQAHHLLSEAARAAGDVPRALGHVIDSLTWERVQVAPWALGAQLLHEQGDSALALGFLARALAKAPGDSALLARQAAVMAQPRQSVAHPHLAHLTRRPTVSLCMIVKNETQFLARCLSTAREQVDEIVVVDTGSTDDTVAIAAAHGAVVGHFAWIDDFAAARNHSLELATGDWALVLDADEVLEAPPDFVRRLLDALPDPTLSGLVPLVNVRLHNHLGTALSADTWHAEALPRLFPRAALRYKGAVHEAPTELVPSDSPRRLEGFNSPGLVVHHDGYRPEMIQTRDKLTRNIQLLRRRVAADETDTQALYFLGRELDLAGRAEEADTVLETCWQRWPDASRPWYPRQALTSHAQALLRLERWDEALAVLARARGLDPEYPSYWHLAGVAALGAQRPAEAIAWFEGAIARRDYAAKFGIHPYNAVVPEHAGSRAEAGLAEALAAVQGRPQAPAAAATAPVHGLIQAAFAHLNAGALGEARSTLLEAHALDPTHGQVPYLLAEVAQRAGEMQAALGHAADAVRLAGGRAEPWALTGLLLHQDEDSALAAAFLLQALRLQPHFENAERLLAQVRSAPRVGRSHPTLEALLNSGTGQTAAKTT